MTLGIENTIANASASPLAQASGRETVSSDSKSEKSTQESDTVQLSPHAKAILRQADEGKVVLRLLAQALGRLKEGFAKTDGKEGAGLFDGLLFKTAGDGLEVSENFSAIFETQETFEQFWASTLKGLWSEVAKCLSSDDPDVREQGERLRDALNNGTVRMAGGDEIAGLNLRAVETVTPSGRQISLECNEDVLRDAGLAGRCALGWHSKFGTYVLVW